MHVDVVVSMVYCTWFSVITVSITILMSIAMFVIMLDFGFWKW